MLLSELPRSLTVHWRRILHVLLGEAFLGFLAIISAALSLAPMLFPVTPSTSALFESLQWGIIGLFALEYVVALSFSPDKRSFLRNPWRILDLVTIFVPLITLFPEVSDMLRSAPVLRLIRLTRVIAMGVRATGVIVRQQQSQSGSVTHGLLEVSLLCEDNLGSPRQASWKELLQWVRKPDESWYAVASPGPEHLHEIAQAAGLSPIYLEDHYSKMAYPHLETSSGYAMLFVWIPELRPNRPVERNGLLLLATAHSVFSLARRSGGLAEMLAEIREIPEVKHYPFGIRITHRLLRAILHRNEELVRYFERELQDLEELPVRESRPQFFEQTFRLKKELSATQADLWRLKGVIASLAEAHQKLPGAGPDTRNLFEPMARDVEYLYETVANIREGLLSLIDLHLNVVSFEINRVMRVLAVVSALGLIPAVVGGLFGMNLADNPWPFTLPQVSFSVGLAMILSFYLFMVKGWLR